MILETIKLIICFIIGMYLGYELGYKVAKETAIKLISLFDRVDETHDWSEEKETIEEM